MNLESHLPLILDLCLKSSAILLAAFGVAWLARKTSAARRHLIWLAAFVTLAILPLTLAIPPRWSWAWQRQTPTRSTLLPALPDAIRELRDSPATTTPAQPAWRLPDWPVIAGGAWLAGALLLLARQGVGFWKLRGLRRRSSAITSGLAAELANDFGAVEMRESPLCAVPLTWGWLRPVVLLPAAASSWPELQLRAAVAHEFGHIARRDFLSRQLAQIVRAFFWPNPLVWLAVRALHRTQEQACDDLVLSRGAAPNEYATQLLETARSLAAPMFMSSQAVAMALPSTLEGRVRAIVDEQCDRRAPGRLSRASAAAAIIAVVAGSAFAQVKSPPPAEPAAPQILIEAKFIEFPDTAMDTSKFPRNLTAEESQIELNKLAAKKGVDILSAPRVITRSGQRAAIEISGPETDSKSIGLRLDVPPTVKLDGSGGLKLDVLPTIKPDGLHLDLEFTLRKLLNDALRTSKLTASPILALGHTAMLLGHSMETGRSLLIVVTASLVDEHALPPPKTVEPPAPKTARGSNSRN